MGTVNPVIVVKDDRKPGDKLLAGETDLRDDVLVGNDPLAPYSTATVIDKGDREVTLFRPYVHTGDFSYTAGVLHYLGFEKFTVWFDTPVLLLKKGDPVR